MRTLEPPPREERTSPPLDHHTGNTSLAVRLHSCAVRAAVTARTLSLSQAEDYTRRSPRRQSVRSTLASRHTGQLHSSAHTPASSHGCKARHAAKTAAHAQQCRSTARPATNVCRERLHPHPASGLPAPNVSAHFACSIQDCSSLSPTRCSRGPRTETPPKEPRERH